MKKLRAHLVLVLFVLAWGLLAGGVSAASYRVSLDPESYLQYEATTPLEVWQGRAPLHRVEGSLDPQNPTGALELRFEVEPDAFRSGNAIRDINAQRTVFETATYPLITFTARSLEGGAPLEPNTAQDVTVTGSLAIHGVEQTLSLPVTVERTGETLTAMGTFRVLLSDYGMRRPSVFFVTVDDEVRVDFVVSGTLIPE